MSTESPATLQARNRRILLIIAAFALSLFAVVVTFIVLK
jgi:hypothetical protein